MLITRALWVEAPIVVDKEATGNVDRTDKEVDFGDVRKSTDRTDKETFGQEFADPTDDDGDEPIDLINRFVGGGSLPCGSVNFSYPPSGEQPFHMTPTVPLCRWTCFGGEECDEATQS